MESAAATAPDNPPTAETPDAVSLATVAREWGRIGCIGFGGPPTHIKLLRELCVERRGWLDAREFEDAIAVCNLLPGPASTELAIFCAWRMRGRLGALVGGAAFIVPGLIVILALSALFLAKSPRCGYSAPVRAPVPRSRRWPSTRAAGCQGRAGSAASRPSAGWLIWSPGRPLLPPWAPGWSWCCWAAA